MNEFKFEGKIERILELKSGTGKNGEWKSVDFICKEDKDKFPQSCKFTVSGKDGDGKFKADTFLKYKKVGDHVEVSFNLRCNEHNGSYYNNIDAWSVFSPKGDSNQSNGGDVPF